MYKMVRFTVCICTVQFVYTSYSVYCVCSHMVVYIIYCVSLMSPSNILHTCMYMHIPMHYLCCSVDSAFIGVVLIVIGRLFSFCIFCVLSLKDHVSLLRWNDGNYWALKDAIKKNHMAVAHLIRKYKVGLTRMLQHLQCDILGLANISNLECLLHNIM